ncbi:MAG TPA: antitoxin MazE-like protein, partial [Terriglobales bacterium]
MATRASSTTSRDKVRAYRKRLRQQGLRPIQIWVPDVNSLVFASRHTASLAPVARSRQEHEDQDFL